MASLSGFVILVSLSRQPPSWGSPVVVLLVVRLLAPLFRSPCEGMPSLASSSESALLVINSSFLDISSMHERILTRILSAPLCFWVQSRLGRVRLGCVCSSEFRKDRHCWLRIRSSALGCLLCNLGTRRIRACPAFQPAACCGPPVAPSALLSGALGLRPGSPAFPVVLVPALAAAILGPSPGFV